MSDCGKSYGVSWLIVSTWPRRGRVRACVSSGGRRVDKTGPAVYPQQLNVFRRRGRCVRCSAFFFESVPHTIPNFFRVDGLIRIELLCFFQQNISRLGIGWISDAAIIDRADRRTLRLVKMTDALCAPVVRNDVNIVSLALAIAHMVSFCLGVTALFEDCLIGTFWQAGSTIDTF